MIDSYYEYYDAVHKFKWPVEASTSNVDAIVNSVADQVRAAKQIKNFPGGQDLSLVEIYIEVIRDLDRKNQTYTDTLICIATSEERAVAKRVFVDLKERFNNDEDADLKSATLLFGIKKIKEFVKSQLANPHVPIKVEAQSSEGVTTLSVKQLEAIVIDMKGMRDLLDAIEEKMPFIKAQIDELDKQIELRLKIIQILKDSQAKIA